MIAQLKENFDRKNITLVAVSKTMPVEKIMPVYRAGHRIFGENRTQEMAEKHNLMPKDIQWHMIGHLQKNKVKYIADFVSMIQSVDNEKLLQVIDKEAFRHNRKIDYLLQMKIAEEDSKYGLSFPQVKELIEKINSDNFPNTRCRGLMGMATFTEDTAQIKKEFASLKTCFDSIRENLIKNKTHFDTLSMGMSGDYEIALTEGSNMVRIGSLIFGERN